MKRITFSIYAVFPLPPWTGQRLLCFLAKSAEEILSLKEKGRNCFVV